MKSLYNPPRHKTAIRKSHVITKLTEGQVTTGGKGNNKSPTSLENVLFVSKEVENKQFCSSEYQILSIAQNEERVSRENHCTRPRSTQLLKILQQGWWTDPRMARHPPTAAHSALAAAALFPLRDLCKGAGYHWHGHAAPGTETSQGRAPPALAPPRQARGTLAAGLHSCCICFGIKQAVNTKDRQPGITRIT